MGLEYSKNFTVKNENKIIKNHKEYLFNHYGFYCDCVCSDV